MPPSSPCDHPTGHLEPPPNRYHMLRVQQPIPSKKHPLAGLWHGIDPNAQPPVAIVVSLAYDFTGGAARIVATPVRHPESTCATARMTRGQAARYATVSHVTSPTSIALALVHQQSRDCAQVQVSQHTYSADRPIWTAAAAPLRRQDELIDLCQAVLEHCNVLDQVLASRLLDRRDTSHTIAS